MRTTIVRVITALALAVFGLVTFAQPSSAGLDGYPLCENLGIGCPPEEGTLVADPPNVAPGQQVAVSGAGCEAGSEVTLTIAGEVVGTGVADADGGFNIPITAPGPGTYTIDGTCGSMVLDSVTITVAGPAAAAVSVTAATPPSSSATLARTGSNVGPTIAVGASLLLLGAAALFGARKRRSLT